MKIVKYSTQNILAMAYLCLRELFDPAYTGSPYELHTTHLSKNEEPKRLFFTKRLSIRM